MFKHVLLFKFIDPEVCAPVVGQKLLALKEDRAGDRGDRVRAGRIAQGPEL